MSTCQTCSHFAQGGCVHPMSSFGFDDPPEQACDLYHERFKAPPKVAAALALQMPPKREDGDRDLLREQLARINREQTPSYWGTRLERSQGRDQ